MYEYYVYNITRKSYCTITCNELLEVEKTVLIKFDNEELGDKLYECRIIKVLRGLTS